LNQDGLSSAPVQLGASKQPALAALHSRTVGKDFAYIKICAIPADVYPRARHNRLPSVPAALRV
jgi:hypothetical protein